MVVIDCTPYALNALLAMADDDLFIFLGWGTAQLAFFELTHIKRTFISILY